ncbi:hypothetical protein ACHAW5_003281 [Stephanodiscus triporus]|uniref:Uncharacterized protein n=1 Tax=Stephanodiscus triporus TaxID=2934178 RepID=A0ABD3PI89_9STRA
MTEEYYTGGGDCGGSRVSQQPSLVSTVSSLTLSRALGDDLDRHEHPGRGFYVATRLGDFVEEAVVSLPASAEDGSGMSAILGVGERTADATAANVGDSTSADMVDGTESDSNAKGNAACQVSSNVEVMASDILSALLPECGVPIPSVMASVGGIRARKGGMLLPWHSTRLIQNYRGRRGGAKKDGSPNDSTHSSSRSILSISSVHSFRG